MQVSSADEVKNSLEVGLIFMRGTEIAFSA